MIGNEIQDTEKKMTGGRVHAICVSEKRGTEKHAVEKASFKINHGIVGDAHAGNWHRQVSLLSYDKVLDFNKRGADVKDGAFGENLVVEGIDFRSLPVGTVLKCNDVILKMTQIGKECHSHCAIYKRMGECIMPKQGVFAEVIKEGTITVGDMMSVELPPADAPLRAAVVVMSDKASKGERVDESGPKAEEILNEKGYEVVERNVISDDTDRIKKELIRLADQRQVDLIITSGGTGMSVRDNTPEATLAVCDRQVPGISEAIRYESMKYTDRAMLSRGVSAMRGKTLIVNLPGSPKAVKESLDIILGPLDHGLRIAKGLTGECARS